MMRLSKKMLFAIEAVLDIAYNAGGSPVQSAEITHRQGIPRRYLEQVLQQLVHAQILAGVRGPRGGYRLARERRRISVGDIIRVVRKLETGANPLEEPAGSSLAQLVVRPLWQEVEEDSMNRLDGVSIDELCQRAQRQGIRREVPAALDFSI